MTVIHVIAPYRYRKTWVFDDPAVGLRREAFVSGADLLLDLIAKQLKRKRFVIQFSARPFPSAQFSLDRRTPAWGGTWYYAKSYKTKAWLCSALLKYFRKAPQTIYVAVQ